MLNIFDESVCSSFNDDENILRKRYSVMCISLVDVGDLCLVSVKSDAVGCWLLVILLLLGEYFARYKLVQVHQ